tara:strand:+ start:1361 stop:1636 length:276 start_codon:yes stop_codon:yes gene_type:complete
MNLLKSFKKFLEKKDNSTEGPEGFCPQCWGRQEYEGKFYEAVYKEKINTKNLASKQGWINAYVKQNLEGIKLEAANGIKGCPSCNLSYKKL